MNSEEIKKIPAHVAIIMDGNGRWASKRGLPRSVGHKAGVDAIKDVVIACSNLGIKILTVYAFSTENWSRPKDEVNFLMSLLVDYMKKEIDELNKNNVKIKVLGDLSILPETTKKEINNALAMTQFNTGLKFNIALNYGGRKEIINAVKNIIYDIESGNKNLQLLDEEMFRNYLYTESDPDPDVVIRTSGEIRLSNFLLWQSAYSELVFTDTLWPDFKKDDLIKAIIEYQIRDRRYGNVR